jgi:hypothetical protein
MFILLIKNYNIMFLKPPSGGFGRTDIRKYILIQITDEILKSY